MPTPQEVAMFPTPQASDAARGPDARDREGSGGPNLLFAAQTFPRPSVMDAAGLCGKPDKGRTGLNSGRTLTGKVLELEGMGPHAEKFPSPRVEDSQCCGAHNGTPDSLHSYTQFFPTPSHKGMDGGSNSRKAARARGAFPQDGGQLNPTWVEWLMRWPLGWTDLQPLEMDKFPFPPPLPGNS